MATHINPPIQPAVQPIFSPFLFSNIYPMLNTF